METRASLKYFVSDCRPVYPSPFPFSPLLSVCFALASYEALTVGLHRILLFHHHCKKSLEHIFEIQIKGPFLF